MLSCSLNIRQSSETNTVLGYEPSWSRESMAPTVKRYIVEYKLVVYIYCSCYRLIVIKLFINIVKRVYKLIKKRANKFQVASSQFKR